MSVWIRASIGINTGYCWVYSATVPCSASTQVNGDRYSWAQSNINQRYRTSLSITVDVQYDRTYGSTPRRNSQPKSQSTPITWKIVWYHYAR